jgi:dynein heavy chain
LANPHYPPEICAQVTLLNFTATPEGLQDQLVNIAVNKEHASMANKWQLLIQRYYDFMSKIKEAEKEILQLLSNQTGNILDDEKLIGTLNNSKKISKEAELGLNDIEFNRKNIKKTAETYKEVGFRVGHLFFCVMDLAGVEPMYQFSLDWFTELYTKAIATEPKNKETRVKDIVRIFTQLLFKTVSRSLFEKDKLLFSLLIYLKVLQCDGSVTQAEVRKLLLANIVNTTPDKKNPCDAWLSDRQWAQIYELASDQALTFTGLDTFFSENITAFKHIIESSEPQDEDFPAKYKDLSPVQKLILLRILRPDKIVPAIQKAIQAKLGRSFVEYETFGLDSVLADTRPQTPLIFILSPGSDPLEDIFKLAQSINQEVLMISLGQGQDKAADTAIKGAKDNGKWVVLQNCHLAPSYLLKVEKGLSVEDE